MTAALMTGASCDDPTGDHPEVNSLKKSSSESGQGSRVGWSLTTPEVLGTQMPHIAHNDQGRVLY